MTDRVPYPGVPLWMGERSWTMPGEPPSEFVVWDTIDDEQPYRMAHNRDLMMNHGIVEQDYNFIDYWFGDPADPVTARYYLGAAEISVALSANGAPMSLADARMALPPAILLYLQKRFETIRVLVATGYEILWTAA